MDLSQLGRILGMGVVTGFGTGEEQRKNEIQAADQALRYKIHQENVAELERQHKEREAAAADRFKQEWGVASPEELGAYTTMFNEAGIMPQGPVRRREIPNLLTIANTILGKTPNLEVDPTTGEIYGQSRKPMNLDIPNTGTPAEFSAPTVQEDPLAGFTAEPSGMLTKSATPNRRSVSVQPNVFEKMQDNRRQREEAKAKEDAKQAERTAKEGKLMDVMRARAAIQGGKAMESVLAEYPSLSAKELLGYEPSAPSQPRPTPAEIEAEAAARERGVNSVRSKDPAATRKSQLELEILEARRDAAQSLKELRSGKGNKPSTLTEATLALQRIDKVVSDIQGDYDMPELEKRSTLSDLKQIRGGILAEMKEIQQKKGSGPTSEKARATTEIRPSLKSVLDTLPGMTR